MFKKSGRGRMKPFCINETCENFLPEDKRGYYKKPAQQETAEEEKPAKAAKTAKSSKTTKTARSSKTKEKKK